MAGRVSDFAEQRQIGRAYEAVGVGAGEQLVGLFPISFRRHVSRALEAHPTPP
jgi:hypothetical protein